jgi:hypothetical protein
MENEFLRHNNHELIEGLNEKQETSRALNSSFVRFRGGLPEKNQNENFGRIILIAGRPLKI